MNSLSRRSFIKLGSALAAGAGLSRAFGSAFAAGLENLSKGLPRVIWLQGQSCSGCSVSLLNAENPDIVEVITSMISLAFHQNVSAATGQVAMDAVDRVASDTTPFILIVEGSIPAGMPSACMIGGRTFEEILTPLLKKALFVIGAGTCATYGGIPAGEGNVTGAVSLKDFMLKAGVRTDRFLINCPSCPIHPDSVIGTLAYLAGKGYPAVHPQLLTPDMFFAHSTHDDCPRFHYYSKRVFAEEFGDNSGCLFKLGCLGMLSYTECPRRQWNGGVNWCIRAAAPCVGCSHPQFGLKKGFPLYRKSEQYRAVDYGESARREEKT